VSYLPEIKLFKTQEMAIQETQIHLVCGTVESNSLLCGNSAVASGEYYWPVAVVGVEVQHDLHVYIRHVIV
jgi:hypothetical protein